MYLINHATIEKLKNAGYTDTDIESMHKSKTLVDLLNSFRGNIDYRPNYDGAYYLNGTIVLGKSPYNKLSTLAHELGHAVGLYQAESPNSSHFLLFEKYNTARDYANARERGEGEAIYYEVTVGEELEGSQYLKESKMWYDNATSHAWENHSARIKPLMLNYSGEKLYEEIGKINAEMIASGGSGEIQLTYDETNIIDYLAVKRGLGNLNSDYNEVMGTNLYNFGSNGYPEQFINIVHVKSLTNKSNGHYGENGNDILKNTHNGGTALATGVGDLLYGGKGNDILIGNSSEDILLGGDDNDELYGKEGRDTLGGNAGNDKLYGDEDQDKLYGGEGNDYIDGGEGIDVIDGGDDKDTLIGGADADTLYGGDGNDILIGGINEKSVQDNNAQNKLYGEAGDDTLKGSGRLEGGKDYDTYYAYDTATVRDEDGQGILYYRDKHLFGAEMMVESDSLTPPAKLDFTKSGYDIKDTTTNRLKVVQRTDKYVRYRVTGDISFVYDKQLTTDALSDKELGVQFFVTVHKKGYEPPPNFPTKMPPPAPPLPPPPPRDPLVLDLNGDGKISTLPKEKGVYFDLDNSGFAEKTAWMVLSINWTAFITTCKFGKTKTAMDWQNLMNCTPFQH